MEPYLGARGLSGAENRLLVHPPVGGGGPEDPRVDELYDGVELLQVVLDRSACRTQRAEVRTARRRSARQACRRRRAPVRMTLRLQLRLLRAEDVLMLLFFNLWPSSQTMRPKSTFCTWNRDQAAE